MAMVAPKGSDGVPLDIPVIAYTEKALEEKELELRKYIEENYLKIRNVEKELAELTLQIKLTAGPKKAALELLRKKVELSGEKIKKAKIKEEQARKDWESAKQALKDAEDEKKNLCDDLTRLVEESAAAQYSRLEELRAKLQALNPELSKATSHPVNEMQGKPAANKEEPMKETPVEAPQEAMKEARVEAPRASRGRGGGRTKGRSSLVLKAEKQSGWTGSGFDVE